MSTPGKEEPFFPAHLMETLSRLLHYPVTLVTAPSGAGKTTSVRFFLKEREEAGTRVLWYTAFGETPDTAWERICGLLAKVDVETAAQLRALDFPVRQTLSALAELTPRLRCPQETVLVVDNAQMLKCSVPYELLSALALHGCPQFHLVVITQSAMKTPPTPMSSAGILFLDADTFFFRRQDVADYFLLNGAPLGQAELEQVMENTSGWAAALRLQLLGYRQTGQIQRENGIGRLLRTALWEPLPLLAKHFLLAFSHMENATIEQVGVLMACRELPFSGTELLDRGWFIQFDPQSNSYTLHSLLREFLKGLFGQLPQEEQRELYRCTGKAYLLDGMSFPAMSMLFLAGDCEEMLAIPFTNADMAGYGADEVLSLLRDILATCPPQLLRRYPAALLGFAFEALMRGEDRLYTEYRAIVSQALQTPGAFGDEERRRLQGEYFFLSSFAAGNDLAKIHAAQKTALESLDGPSRAFDTRHFWTFGVPSILAQFWTDHLPLAETLDVFESGIPVYQVLTGGNAAGGGELIRAEALLDNGQIDTAEALCHKALYLANTGKQDTIGFCAELMLGRFAILRGDAMAYTATLDAIHRRTVTGREKTRHLMADQCVAFLCTALGRVQEVPPWLQSETDIKNHMYHVGTTYGMVLLGRYLLLKKEYNRLAGLSDLFLKLAESQHVLLAQVHFLLFLACTSQAAGEAENTQRYLQRALDIALPDGMYLPFAEHAAELATPLAIWKNESGAKKEAAVIQLLAKMHYTGAARINRTLYAANQKLTPREIEIAFYAKQGISNKEIAERLFISPETVKKTMKSVFSKLDIKSRRQLEDIEFC